MDRHARPTRRLEIADHVATNLVTAHDAPGTAPLYRRQSGQNLPLLTRVGRIISGIRKHLQEVLSRTVFQDAGLPLDGIRIADFRVEATGATIRVEDGHSIGAPWSALELAGQAHAALPGRPAELREHEVDDDERWIEFGSRLRGSEVTLHVDEMERRARANRGMDPGDAHFVQWDTLGRP